MNPYFIYQDKQQIGPFTLGELQDMLASGTLQQWDLCWREGMADWKAIGAALPGLLSTPQKTYNLPPIPATAADIPRHYGGISRRAYALNCFAAAIASGFADSPIGADQKWLAGIAGLLGLSLIFTTILRLVNTGQSLWILLVLLAPALNLIFISILPFYLLIAQEGHAQTKNLDITGKRMVRLLFVGLALLLLALVSTLFSEFGPLLFLK